MLCVALLGAAAANAAPTGFTFAGTIESASGSIGGVAIAPGTPFSGVLVYDPQTPATATGPGLAAYEIDPGGISVEVDGLGFATNPLDSEVSAAMEAIGFYSETGDLCRFSGPENQLCDLDDRDFVLSDLLSVESVSNDSIGSELYEILFTHIANYERELVLEGSPLPDSADDFFEAAGFLTITGTEGADFELSGRITGIAEIPEPSSLALVLFGGALAALRRRRALAAGRDG